MERNDSNWSLKDAQDLNMRRGAVSGRRSQVQNKKSSGRAVGLRSWGEAMLHLRGSERGYTRKADHFVVCIPQD